MENYIYKIEDNSIENLKNLGFRHVGDGVYQYEFAGYKWHNYTTITCKIKAFDDTDRINIDVYTENGDLYSPYYSDEKDSKVLAVVKANIKKEFERLDIKKFVRKKKEKNIIVLDRRANKWQH